LQGKFPLFFREERIRKTAKNYKFWKSMGFSAAFQVVRVTGKAENTADRPAESRCSETHRLIFHDEVYLMRSGNPTLKETTFQDLGAFSETGMNWVDGASARSATMTIQGTAQKTFILLLIAFATAGFTWMRVMNGGAVNFAAAAPWVVGGCIVGLICSLVICFKPTTAPVMAPVYAAAEGLFLGGLSATFESRYPGIVVLATGCTFGTLAALLLAYQSGLIRATENFKLGMFAATGGLALMYLVSFVGSFFGFGIPFIHSSGLIGIGFSVFVVVIAALNLVLDFDFIEDAARRGAPKHLEWYGAFALMVTLVWLYIEILRLLSKLSDRR
jgi:uncharacterized YccA/Bax inhibitor family protein